MRVNSFKEVGGFLSSAGGFLETYEAANSLMLGVAFRIRDHPERIQDTPFLATVEDGNEVVLAAIMTPPYHMVLPYTPGDANRAVDLLVDYLLAEGCSLPGVLGPIDSAQRFARRWMDKKGGRFQLTRRQRVHRLDKVLLPEPEEGRLRLAKDADLTLLAGWRKAFIDEALDGADHRESRTAIEANIRDGSLFVWDVGRPVSMALKIRPTRHGMSIGLVYTPPEQRRRGYATACVAQLSRALLAEGLRFCALYTDLSNPTSNHIYWQIGYRPVCDVDQYTLEL
jgi:ribosomal protein S18 acetylase RimI-like enzyme